MQGIHSHAKPGPLPGLGFSGRGRYQTRGGRSLQVSASTGKTMTAFVCSERQLLSAAVHDVSQVAAILPPEGEGTGESSASWVSKHLWLTTMLSNQHTSYAAGVPCQGSSSCKWQQLRWVLIRRQWALHLASYTRRPADAPHPPGPSRCDTGMPPAFNRVCQSKASAACHPLQIVAYSGVHAYSATGATASQTWACMQVEC